MATSSLLQTIETFLTKHGLQPTTFGREALNDPSFVFDLRNGRDLRRSTEDRVRIFIKSYRK